MSRSAKTNPPDGRLYANENFPKQIADELSGRYHHDVLTTVAAGNANRAVPDEEVLAFALSQNRILLTHNRRHFVRFHREVPKHAGIIVCAFDPDFVGQAQRIHEAIDKETDIAGKLIRINRPENPAEE
jgi:hypothetical protein